MNPPPNYVPFGLCEPDKFMARLRQGYSFREVLTGRRTASGKREKGQGSPRGFRSHCRAFPEWGAEAMRLIQVNAIAAQKRKGQGRGAATHCQRGHLLRGANLGIAPKRGARYCKACHKAANDRGAPMAPEKVEQVRRAREEVVQNIFEALVLRAVSREALPSRITDFITDYNRANPGMYFGTIRSPFSLDDTVHPDSDRSLIDTVSAGLWDE